jgi:hypothetical protein
MSKPHCPHCLKSFPHPPDPRQLSLPCPNCRKPLLVSCEMTLRYLVEPDTRAKDWADNIKGVLGNTLAKATGWIKGGK